MQPPEFDRSNISLAPADVAARARSILDDTHRELIWIRTALIALFYLVLSVYNYASLENEPGLTATAFSLAVVVSFGLLTIYHRFIDYPASQANLMTFGELSILQADGIAFSIVTNDLMAGFGVYMMIIGAGVFMTSARWVISTSVLLLASWIAALAFMGAVPDMTREGMMLVAAVFGAYFFFSMRVRSARRLAEHQLMEEKYKETLEQALAHIETLSGLLPICANCKSIRDEDDAWTELDVYVRDRSAVEFTHSLCPACQEILYPGFSG